MDQANRIVNPYRPPEPLQLKEPRAKRETYTGLWFRWPLVFAVNLIVPVMWASTLVTRHGKVGMVAALPLLYLAGWATCRIHPRCARSMVNGGALVALTQLIPIPQIMAGLFALYVTGLDQQVFGDLTVEGLPSERGGFLVTLLVGGLLMGMAFCLGLTVETVTAWVTPRLSAVRLRRDARSASED